MSLLKSDDFIQGALRGLQEMELNCDMQAKDYENSEEALRRAAGLFKFVRRAAPDLDWLNSGIRIGVDPTAVHPSPERGASSRGLTELLLQEHNSLENMNLF